MPELRSLKDTIEAIAGCDDDRDVWDRYAWVYVDGDGPLAACRFYLSSPQDEEDALDDDATAEAGRPAFAVAHALDPYLEAATFADVLTVQKRQQPLSGVDDYARALEHYHRQDAFLDLGAYADGEVAAPVPGMSRGLFAEYDLTLAACPPARIGDAARAVSALLDVPLPQALAWCRQVPVSLGTRIDARACARIEQRFADLRLPLERRVYRSLAWQITGA